MNLFRSEEHVHSWTKFTPNSEEGIVPVHEMIKIFSGNLFKKRLDSDYMSRFQEYMEEFAEEMTELGKTRSFWAP